ncbi:MAG: hypothetical protein ACI9DF_005052 [Verrucomicrobiales bacterium]
MREFLDRCGWLINRPYFGPQHRIKTMHPCTNANSINDIQSNGILIGITFYRLGKNVGAMWLGIPMASYVAIGHGTARSGVR